MKNAHPSIAILGWGSLLWEHAPEFDNWHRSWTADGPTLPIEFARISQSREGALTLVIDHEVGTPATISWCRSKRTTLEDALCDLRCREGTTGGNIGRLLVAAGPTQHADTQVIHAWGQAHGVQCVVWTALKGNFLERQGVPFSLQAACDYLRALPSTAKTKAAEYIYRAPAFLDTALRRAVRDEPWFREECQRHSQDWPPNPLSQRAEHP